MDKNSNNSDVLKLAEAKMGKLGDILDNANAQASSFVQFILHLNELKDDLVRILKSLREKSEEVGSKERLLETRESELGVFEKRVEELEFDMEMKKEKLGLYDKRVKEYDFELEKKKKELDLLGKKVEDCNFKFKKTEEYLRFMLQKTEESGSHYKSKEKEFISLKNSVEICCEKLRLKEKEAGEAEKLLKERSAKVKMEEEKFRVVQNSVESKKRFLDELERKMEKYYEENLWKDKELGEKQKSLEECCSKLELMEVEFDTVKNFFNEKTSELELKEKRLESLNDKIEGKEKELGEMKESLEEYCSKLELMELELDTVKNFVNEKKGELELKEKKLESLNDEIEGKEKELSGLRNTIDESAKELTKEEFLRDSIRVLVDEYAEELELRERKYNEKNKAVEDCDKILEAKRKDIEVFEKRIEDYAIELRLKEEKLKSVEKEREKRTTDMRNKERDFEERIKEREKCLEECLLNLETKEKEFEKQVKEFERKQKQSLFPSCNNDSGSNLQWFLNEHLKKHDFVMNHISSMLRTAADPGNRVLNAMQGFYPSNSGEQKMEFDLDIVRKSCMVLLNQLFINSPDRISPQVQDKALKLANEWKSKMRVAADNNLEVLGFLHLLAAFKLGSNFDVDELKHLLDSIAQHRQEPVLRQALGIADKAPVIDENLNEQVLEPGYVSDTLRKSPDPAKFVLDLILWLYSTQKKMGGSGFEGTVLRHYSLLLGQLREVSPKISPQIKEEAAKLAFEWKNYKFRTVIGDSAEVICFLQFLAIYELVSWFQREEILRVLLAIMQHKMAPKICWLLGFTDLVPIITQNLIGKNLFIEAIRFHCAFKLEDKAQPEAVLQEFLEHVRTFSDKISQQATANSKDKVVDFDQIAALRTLVEFVKFYKLEWLLPSERIQRWIVEVENLKANQTLTTAAPNPILELQKQLRRNQNVGASMANSMFPPQVPVGYNILTGNPYSATNQIIQEQQSQKRARMDSIPNSFSRLPVNSRVIGNIGGWQGNDIRKEFPGFVLDNSVKGALRTSIWCIIPRVSLSFGFLLPTLVH